MAKSKQIDADRYIEEAVAAVVLALPAKYPGSRVVLLALHGLLTIRDGDPVFQSDLDELYAAFDEIAVLAMERSGELMHADGAKPPERAS
ncbi:MAG TPA: hypothetical protein VGF56_16855 [Rhizomicrobium sp.]|jgi:hypothetical protein